MNVPTEYCILVFIVVIISIILTNIEKEVICAILGLLILYCYSKSNKNDDTDTSQTESFVNVENFNNVIQYDLDSSKINITNNPAEMNNQDDNTADGLLYKAAIRNGKKEKDSKDIRSSWNNPNVKKYFIDELEEQENRNWWEDDDDVLKKNYKGVVPF